MREVSLGTAHKPLNVNVLKTHMPHNGHASFLSLCPNTILIKESTDCFTTHLNSMSGSCALECEGNADHLGNIVFNRTKVDDKPALSVEDQAFIDSMEKEVHQNTRNSWVAPLPFRCPRPHLPSDRE